MSSLSTAQSELSLGWQTFSSKGNSLICERWRRGIWPHLTSHISRSLGYAVILWQPPQQQWQSGASATPYGSPRTADNWICLPGSSGNQSKWIFWISLSKRQRRKDGDKMRPHSGLSLRLSGIWSDGAEDLWRLKRLLTFAVCQLSVSLPTIHNHSIRMGLSFEFRLTGLPTVAFECQAANLWCYWKLQFTINWATLSISVSRSTESVRWFPSWSAVWKS